ncbi:hypothetical protein [Falsiroseomonas sp.]|uniref:hypothetical protein n=1 Tax=Falsiroseomonas sp. TaxID=2870721 RepID=UPI00271F32A2|nr:hypothetical protein [Falsiroseomonas sp.]MDO9501423.1 hypothetical protein [Falsiroseomonas sp.]
MTTRFTCIGCQTRPPAGAGTPRAVPKALIVEAVRQGAGEAAARGLAGAKKDDIADTAVGLLDGKGWAPSLLRVPSVTAAPIEAPAQMAAE